MSSILKAVTGHIENNVTNVIRSMVNERAAPVIHRNTDRVNEIASNILHGPWLYTQGQDLANDVWKVSMSLVIQVKDPDPLVKCLGKIIPGEVFFKKDDLAFLRYAFPIKMLLGEQQIDYSINNQNYTFFAPGIFQESKGMYFTCNGTQDKNNFLQAGKVEKMWQAFNSLLAKDKCNFMICGGDFIYSDGFEEYEKDAKVRVKALGLFELPSIQDWLSMDSEKRDAAPFTKEMEEEVFRFYFEEYLKHLDHPELKEAISRNPYMGIWDDHDIFDGFGSYADSLNNSPVFKGLYQAALTNYLLFQHQTTLEKAYEEGLFGPQGYNFLRYFDNGQIAILGLDNRSGRTREKILSEENWLGILNKLEDLPINCRHLVVMLGVPIVYTSVKEFVELMEFPISQEVFTKFKALRNQFGMLELEDDGIDHWDCKEHEEERKFVIQMFQVWATKKGVRVTFLSGDVHSGGLGVILPKTAPQIMHSDDLKAIASVPSAMVQIISSAIENDPPSKDVTYFIGKFGAAPRDVDKNTISKLLHVSNTQKKIKKKILIAKRNYGILKMNGEDLKVTIYKETKKTMNSKFFVWRIPPNTYTEPVSKLKI